MSDTKPVESETQLLPCPFCGGHKIIAWKSDDVIDDNPVWCVFCQDCEAEGPHDLSRTAVASKWNYRTPSSEVKQNTDEGGDAGPVLSTNEVDKDSSTPLATEAAQTWCDHCSGDLNGTQHVLDDKCYQRFAHLEHPFDLPTEEAVRAIAERFIGSGDNIEDRRTGLQDAIIQCASDQHQRGMLEAAEIAVGVRADANERLGLVPGNIAFENGRAKAAEEIKQAIRSRISTSPFADPVPTDAEIRLQKIREIADLGSALELNDAQDRLEAIVKIAG